MRSRIIRPTIYSDENLADLPSECFRLYLGLTCMADREGRLQDRPKRIKAIIFPHDPDVDIELLLNHLASPKKYLPKEKFILRYEVNGERFIQITGKINAHTAEKKSDIPTPPGKQANKLATTVVKGVKHNVTKHEREREAESLGFPKGRY